MAEDKGKKKGTKGKSKKDEPRNWAKIGLQVFIVLVIGMSVIAFTLNVNRGGSNTNSGKSNSEKSFNGIADGLSIIPANASYALYVDLKNDSVLSNFAQGTIWIYGTMASQKVFGASPQRNLFAIYPAGYFGDFTEQIVSLTDFGKASINQSYPDYYSIQGIIAKRVNDKYFYTGATKPVISGRIENVAPVVEVFVGNNVSAYGNYSGLFDEMKWKQIPSGGMTLEVVGRACNLSYVDGYYAGVRPVDRGNTSSDRLYNYTVVMHLNQTPPDRDLQDLALLEKAMEKMGFVSYRVQVYDDYIIIEAQGNLAVCLDNMQNRWGFIKYQYSL